jgi:hypothetical protein
MRAPRTLAWGSARSPWLQLPDPLCILVKIPGKIQRAMLSQCLHQLQTLGCQY